MAIKVVAGLFMSIATVAVMLRCYVRGWIVKAFGWDDSSMVMAMVICPPLIALYLRHTYHHIGLVCNVLWVHDWSRSTWQWTPLV